MEKVKSIIFRKLTDADFFNINKPSGTEARGGGQSYIDISTSAVRPNQWTTFFDGINPTRTPSGPKWEFEVHSLGVNISQRLTIGQRRATTFSIRAQKISSSESNRVYAWYPDYTNFPRPSNPSIREHIYNLVIYLVSLENGTYWAGWFQASRPEPSWPLNDALNDVFLKGEGFIENSEIFFDSNDPTWPFRINSGSGVQAGAESGGLEIPTPPVVSTSLVVPRPEEEILKELFDEDEAISSSTTPAQKEEIRKIRVRNSKAVKLLKELYGGKCQLTGERFTFMKKDGTLYSEGHHLIPLGKEGSDSILNLVVVSPLIHKMLHYADVTPIDLTRIENSKLTIAINRVEYTITWHPEHARVIAHNLQE